MRRISAYMREVAFFLDSINKTHGEYHELIIGFKNKDVQDYIWRFTSLLCRKVLESLDPAEN